MRAGWIGTWSEVSSASYFTYHSRQMPSTSETQALRCAAVARSAAFSIAASVTLASPFTIATSG